jgi:polyferredoxin
MPDLAERIETMYQRDRLWAWVGVATLWVTILAVLVLSWPYIPDKGVRFLTVVGAGAVLIFNTAAIAAMIKHFAEDKQFIYSLDIKGLDAMKARK